MGALEIVWDGSLETGHRATDVQHKYLVDIINELARAIEEGSSERKLGEILNLLEYYAEWHFAREEKCMLEHQCPTAEKNVAAHAYFLETFTNFRKDFRASGGSVELAREMYKVLTDWLVSHIQKVDGALGPCVHSGPPSAS